MGFREFAPAVKSFSWSSAKLAPSAPTASSRSMPAQKTCPAALIKIEPTCWLLCANAIASTICEHISAFNALRLSGRFSVNSRTRPFSSLTKFIGSRLDFHHQERRSMRLTLCISTERDCAAAVQGFFHHKIECTQIGQFVSCNGATNERAEMRFDPLRRDFSKQN